MIEEKKKNSIFAPLGASNHALEERQVHDYYATNPIAGEMLMELETFNKNIWEPACGGGHLSKVFASHGYDVYSTDLYDRGYGDGFIDFLDIDPDTDGVFDGDIITNPPYKYALEFVQKALDVIPQGNKVAMFLKLTFLEGKKRREFFKDNPPKRIWVSSSRLDCAKNGDFEKSKKNQSAACYAWFIWEKGFNGEPVIKWFN